MTDCPIGHVEVTAHFTGTSGTPDSTTAYYMGGAYEVKDATVKKYYSIAGMMIAVNDGRAVQYLLGGARSIPNSPIAGTDFTYTGQRMLDSGMGGIMDYREASPSRFLASGTRRGFIRLI